MKSVTWLRCVGWCLAPVVLLMAHGFAVAQDPAPPDGPPPGGPHRHGRRIVGRIAPGYQLKISVIRVPAALDAQLKLDGKGILVSRVYKGGPADKAGIKAHDILVAANDKPLEKSTDLLLITKESDGEPVLLTVLRGGEEKTIEVKPERQARKSGLLLIDPIGPLHVDISELHGIDAKIREKLEAAGVDLRMQLIEPGKYLPKGGTFLFGDRTEIPDDLSITIHKQGNQPADIEVKQGEDSWSVKENDLAPLPDKVRKHVEGFLGRGPMRFNVVGKNAHGFVYDDPRPPHPPKGPRPPRMDHREDELERAFDQMSRRMREMRNELEGMRRHVREELREQIHERRDRREDRRDRPARPERPERDDEPETDTEPDESPSDNDE